MLPPRSSIARAFQPSDGSRGEQLCLLWDTLQDTAIGLWAARGPRGQPNDTSVIAEAQRALSRHSTQACADALKASFPPGTEDGKRSRARLLSCGFRPSSAWLSALLLSRALKFKNGKFHACLRQRTGLSPNATYVQCGSQGHPALHGRQPRHVVLRPGSTDHAVPRHPVRILRRAVHPAGIASTRKPALCRLPRLTVGPGISGDSSPSRPGARGDILLAITQGIATADMSVIHPLSDNSLLVAVTSAGVAAALHVRITDNIMYHRCESGGESYID
jgi:hypothetical protein